MDEFAMGGHWRNIILDQLKMLGTTAARFVDQVVQLLLASGQSVYHLVPDTGGSIANLTAFNRIGGLKANLWTLFRFDLIAFGSSLDQVGTFRSNCEKKRPNAQYVASEGHKRYCLPLFV